MTFSELLSEYLDLRDVAREAETVIEPAAQCRRRNERIAELLAEMTKLVHAASVPRLDPAPTAESFDGITGRPFGVTTGESHRTDLGKPCPFCKCAPYYICGHYRTAGVATDGKDQP